MEANYSIRAVIWDMGGVLVRTEDYTSREKLAEQFHLSRKELEQAVFDSEVSWQAQNGHASSEQMWQEIARRFGLNGKQLQDFEMRFWDGDRLDADLVQLISNLRPKYCTGLLSNAWSDAPASLERRYGPFLSIFDTVVFSAHVGLAKPDPEIYSLLLSRMNMQPREAVFIDDVLVNINGARAVGMQGIQFKNREQIVADLHGLLGD
jgi:epoxide hydrolase-like predicted phosphatase